MNWRWTLRRFRAMSWGERVLRARRALRDREHRRRFRRGGAPAVFGPPPPSDRFRAEGINRSWVVDPSRLNRDRWPGPWRSRTLEESEEILNGRLRWLGVERPVGRHPDWRADTVSGITFPADHWSAIPVFSEDGSADMKHVWEPNIHTAFATLAKAEWLTHETRYGDHLTQLWNGWMEQNPPLGGPNYLAPIEIGLRLLNWAAALIWLRSTRGLDESFLERVWTHVVYQRATIADNLSRHSSANNHVIGELATLVLGDRAFPGLAPPEETARFDAELQREVILQFAQDGGNREQAFHYHVFALAFGLLGAQNARDNGVPWLPRTLERLEAAVAFLDANIDLEGRAFLYGDGDDSEVLPLAEGPRNLYVPILDHGNVLFGNLERAAAEGDERTAWLTGEPGLPDAARPGREAPPTRVFDRSGHGFLRAGAFAVHVNGGPLGYRSIAAHAHADALSVQVRFGGRDVIVDPGTHSYRRGDPWRESFARTAAHPTVTVDARDQALRLGPFLWDHHYTTRFTFENGEIRVAHDGYQNLGVDHERRVRADAERVWVEDTLTGSGSHAIRVTWPFAPGAVRFENCAAHIQTPKGELVVALNGLPGEPRFEAGAIDRPGSPCVSPAYEALEPASALVWEGVVELPITFTTTVSVVRPHVDGSPT